MSETAALVALSSATSGASWGENAGWVASAANDITTAAGPFAVTKS